MGSNSLFRRISVKKNSVVSLLRLTSIKELPPFTVKSAQICPPRPIGTGGGKAGGPLGMGQIYGTKAIEWAHHVDYQL